MSNTLLCLGAGYCARALARHPLMAQGWRIRGTTRSGENAAALARLGIEPLIWSGTDPLPALREASHLLISASPGQEGDPVLAALGDEISRVAPRLTWVGYLSTTGVYGDHHGGWVDEQTPLVPSTARGKMRVRAEAQWAAVPNLALHIFRLAGIYGLGRGPFAKVRAGTARRIVKPGQVFSRAHVDDIAQVLAASIAHPDPGAIYNVCDDDPAPPEDVIAEAARLLGQEIPQEERFETAEMSDMARSFYAENKRVRNERIKRDLAVRLLYPSYREGLAALLAQEQTG
ncbi:SDR family oxidoreductase [Antarcticimicrobium sediminis]|uniref:SDR family oxidoreductase n=1 Tax=Antarcticimicrobium sediminis TaxID=2546227 RepID=A0A4R5EQW7_9RHOB|nr:SDR family oxidoreductase [Antarcticimicrobium sediminis]TDE37094.1 SDR family oxidoreductase [Antarcticimicrobium sediminis]